MNKIDQKDINNAAWDACGCLKKEQVGAWVDAGGAASHITDEKPDK